MPVPSKGGPPGVSPGPPELAPDWHRPWAGPPEGARGPEVGLALLNRPTLLNPHAFGGASMATKTHSRGAVEFLDQWLRDATGRQQELKVWAASATEADRTKMANARGFRHWRQLEQCEADMVHALTLFAADPTFRRIWLTLAEHAQEDEAAGITVPLLGPHNGGVPARILRAIEEWHQTPKFTAAKRRQHHEKIAGKCDELIELLEQVTPSGALDRFSHFLVHKHQALRLFEALGTPLQSRDAGGGYDIGWKAALHMAAAGITPLWAVRSIRAQADGASFSNLPRKLRTPSAFRTFLIVKLSRAMNGSAAIGDQLIADAVGRLTNKDCELDDVRKALAASRNAEEKELAAEHSRPRRRKMIQSVS